MKFDGAKLTELIKKSRKRYIDVAEDLGVARETLHNWRTGKVQPRNNHVDKLAEIFGVNWKIFFKD